MQGKIKIVLIYKVLWETIGYWHIHHFRISTGD